MGKNSSIQHAYYLKHSERLKTYAREWRRAHPGYKSEYDKSHPERRKNNNLQRLYGISFDEYNKMLDAQGGACAICGKPSGTDKYDILRVDHDHDTGEVRGLLCLNCNSMLGLSGDSIQILARSIEYLKED